MSGAAVIRLPTGPARDIYLLKRVLKEAVALGAQFRIVGADVECDRLNSLPAPLRGALEEFSAKGLLWEYLGGATADEAALDLLDRLQVNPVLVDTRGGLRAAVRQLKHDKLCHHGAVAIDIETAPLPGQGDLRPVVHINIDGALSALQPEWKTRAGLDPHRAKICTAQLYAGGDACFICRGDALQMLLRSHWLRRQWLIAHNMAFETSFLRHHGGYAPRADRRPLLRIDCTMQLAGLVIGVYRRSLANTVKERLGFDVPKELQTSDWSARTLSEGQLAYAASDAILAWQLWGGLAPEAHRTGRWEAYELQRRAIVPVADMELRGLGIDRAQHARIAEGWARELTEARREYHQLTGNPPPSKPAEVREWLTTVLAPSQLVSWPRTPTGELSIELKNLKRLVHIPSALPVLRLLAKEKLLANFGAKLVAHISPVTGRLHCNFNIAGSKAGRFSASQPNLQQLPSTKAPEFKRCIVAAPGYVLIGGDWNQVELRAFAWITKDRTLTRHYAEGRDIHAQTAAKVNGISVVEVTKEQRQAAKPLNFGAIYGIGPRALAESAFADYGIEMSEREARAALDSFFKTYAEGDRWRHEHYRLSQQRGYVNIGAGRVVRKEWEPGGNLSFPQCANLPIQGICADAMLRALAQIYARLRQTRIRGGLVATVHDEILLEVMQADAEAARDLLQQTMIDAFVETFPGAPATNVVDVNIGKTWADLK